MHFLTAALLSLSASTLATASSTHAPSSKRHSNLKRGSGYSLTTDARGADFFELFQFEEGSNNNGGMARYVDEATAWKDGLVAVKDGKAHIRVSPEGNGPTRDAVKLVSKQRYSEGLYVWDVERMPQVCGAWPAIWSTGENWPQGGEIDLVEFVSHQTTNAFSVHTGEGCWAGSSGYTGRAMLATQNALNCNAKATSAEGCGFRAVGGKATAGPAANENGGGLYVLEWSSAGIKAWMFQRDEIPKDLASKTPNPSSWTTPDMYISASSCDPSTYFSPQQFVVNTNLCGTWPGGVVWSHDNSYAGQKGSCAADTGFDTCEAYVQSRGWDFKHAYWRIAGLSIYNY